MRLPEGERMMVTRTGSRTTTRGAGAAGRRLAPLTVAALAALLVLPAAGHAQHAEQAPPPPPPAAAAGAAADPRVGLPPGLTGAGVAARHMEHLANRPRPEALASAGTGLSAGNSDLAFQGDHVFVGNFAGFQVFDVSDPAAPVLRTTVVCPGGQGDVSVLGHLLFMSVEQLHGRVDCGAQGVAGAVSPERFRGVRIFDISELDRPRQVAAVQTCRGSHTHTLVPDPADDDVVYVYVSGAAPVRPEAELAGCSGLDPGRDPETALFRIEVIRVPLAAPHEARVVSEPRLFADEGGNIAGLWRGGDHGPGTQRTAQTNHCHDITAYPELGIAAGACSGNGILIDIREPASPRRIHEVLDPNFAYWHSATFNNDGTTVIFTDEWGGGTAARCRPTDPEEWGANAIFEIDGGRMRHAAYYKLPAPQTETENCVAHNGSLVPVPGRDIKVQAWYQGGISVFDFTDPRAPVEIAFFDRGPISATELVTGGFWSAYWHNGYIYGSEIVRGLDVLRLTPSEHLSANELAAAELVRFETFNPQTQPRFVWPAHFVVSRAYVDQLERGGALDAVAVGRLRAGLDAAEALPVGTAERRAALTALAAEVEAIRAPAEARRLQLLTASLRQLESDKGEG
jgi:hypothetical protein